MYADGVIRELASSVHTGCPNQLNESLMPIRPLCVKNKEMGIHQRANAIPRWARVLAMLLLVTSLTCTVAQRTHDDGNSKSRNDAAPSSSAPIAGDHTDTAFVGQWVNEDPNGLTSRLVIKQQGTDLQVHAWGVCRPDDCDWGVETALVAAGTVNVTWNQGFVARMMSLTLRGNVRLFVVTENDYNDGRSRTLLRESFRRAAASISSN